MKMRMKRTCIRRREGDVFGLFFSSPDSASSSTTEEQKKTVENCIEKKKKKFDITLRCK